MSIFNPSLSYLERMRAMQAPGVDASAPLSGDIAANKLRRKQALDAWMTGQQAKIEDVYKRNLGAQQKYASEDPFPLYGWMGAAGGLLGSIPTPVTQGLGAALGLGAAGGAYGRGEQTAQALSGAKSRENAAKQRALAALQAQYGRLQDEWGVL